MIQQYYGVAELAKALQGIHCTLELHVWETVNLDIRVFNCMHVHP